MIVKNILKKAFVFLALSASFLTLNSKEAFATAATEQSELASKLVRNVKEVGNDRYYKGDFYSDVGTYPEGMFLVVENLIENYIAFAHMGEGSYLPTVGQRFEEKIEGQVVKRYIAVSQKKNQGYYCIDIYNNTNDQPVATLTTSLSITKKKSGYFITPKDDIKIVYKGKTYKKQAALEFLGF
ncbi:hypothetical protein [Fusobacterium hwasookii]|uniref:Uncharacterized protein n=1 Tax=Fusobacterium hwasookii ChDC F206 TaxID=1307443 RepID=A0AAC9A0N3_9FUSO|nr:hypothetical protein [Fusobacterium hwasookii]ALQ34654.1 hypothetical protein RN92_01545 [Fusobacterium hwasookii ChDC F206]ALQ38536.1 hypothetical protein RN97_10255 [Fusobacterium hwasookii ChDC F300]QNE68937.1 hypothetical protein H5V38_02945 [Fusobacterium hwasookii]